MNRYAYGLVILIVLGLCFRSVRYELLTYIIHHSDSIDLPVRVRTPKLEVRAKKQTPLPLLKANAATLPATVRAERAKSRGEEECRAIFEDIFPGKKFPSIRPNFLYNPIAKAKAVDSNAPFEACAKAAHCLELDGFNAELMLAFEYQGRQHTEYIPYFHRSLDIYEAQLYRDHIKAELCEKSKVRLVVIPYDQKDLRAFIKRELMRRNLWPPSR